MKLTKLRLKQIIKEELQKILMEEPNRPPRARPITSIPPGKKACSLTKNKTVKAQCMKACTNEKSDACKHQRERVWKHYRD
jgi:hypothetical protein